MPIREREPLLDVLRAFALLGIYVSIIHGFNGSTLYGSEAVGGPLDHFLGLLESLWINKRFIGLLSLLFGIGIAIQQQNFQDCNEPFAGYFVRRMIVLACLGLVNTTFYFNGEILLVYAVFGLITFVLSGLRSRAMIALAAFLFLVPGQVFEVMVRDQLIEWFRWFPDSYSVERVKEVYLGTDYWAMIKLRWIEYAYIYTDNNFHLAMSLALMILGYTIGRRDARVLRATFSIRSNATFIAASIYAAVFSMFGLVTGMSDFIFAYNPVGYVFYAVFLAATLYCYVWVVAASFRLLGSENLVMRAMSNNGRLCLTGYMGGALLYSFIFYGFGLGLYMKYSNGVLLLISLACYGAFTIFSWLWLKRFSRGPLEWVYRRFSYGRLG